MLAFVAKLFERLANVDLNEDETSNSDLDESTEDLLVSEEAAVETPRIGKFRIMVLVASLLISGCGLFVYLSVGKN